MNAGTQLNDELDDLRQKQADGSIALEYLQELYDDLGARVAAVEAALAEEPPSPEPEPEPEPEPASGLWLSPGEIAALPASGEVWDAINMLASTSNLPAPDIANQNDNADATFVAICARHAKNGALTDYHNALWMLDKLLEAPLEPGKVGALAIARNVAPYVVGADLLGLRDADPGRDAAFRVWLEQIRGVVFSGAGPAHSIISNHETRPNNWGTHAGASRIAIALYLGDDEDLERAAEVFRGYLGDRDAYAGFSYGELWWQANPLAPVGVNPAGAVIAGHNVDGVLPDDQRRGGSFTWPPPKENYVWEALQGAVAQAWMLARAGHDAWGWCDQALLRAVVWLHNQADFAAVGDDTGIPWAINRVYGTGFPTAPATPGKNGLGLLYQWVAEKGEPL